MLLPFELDPEIIHHIIYSQAGSIGKAVIELLMNAVDAQASVVQLTMSKEGFECSDDGRGFASRDDVLRYFGRFGTPHQEGDATYGRFRLGRGQIMAHAKTHWASNAWSMTVDTRAHGYNYELDELEHRQPGCSIVGTWYESLNDLELMSAIQEIRDLVRYTTIRVELNGRLITRNPANERWDFEDEWAYYRAKAEGPVSIYNQGVLVRHDSSHVWGAGGLIVSKKAIALNVSRSEVLRKTCPVWKAIAREFGKLAEQVSARLGDHRKTEARREKSARALLSGAPDIANIFHGEEVITLLAGKRHVTLYSLLSNAQFKHNNRLTVVEHAHDVPKGEAIAREGIIQVLHPQTLDRFGCHSPADFEEVLERVIANVRDALADSHWLEQRLSAPLPQLVSFATLRKAFQERTLIVNEKDALDKETCRAWVALRWCLQQYIGACLGKKRYTNGRVAYGEQILQVLLGDSNTAEAWTDGESYLAINSSIVKRLRTDALKTVAYIFGLVEHEVAHQGDSLDCGHDSEFYQRYHDISIRMSPERQRYIHMWLQKYTSSMEAEGKRAQGTAWRERYLLGRVDDGRIKRGLSPVIEDVSKDSLVTAPVPDQSMALLVTINDGLIQSGLCPQPPDWAQVVEQARLEQVDIAERSRQLRLQRTEEDRRFDEQLAQVIESCKPDVARILGVEIATIDEGALGYLAEMLAQGCDDDTVRQSWIIDFCEPEHEWSGPPYDDDYESMCDQFANSTTDPKDDPCQHLDQDCHGLVQTGETWWSLERNASAAGFWRVEHYLKWRHAEHSLAASEVPSHG